MPFPFDKYPWLNFQELNLAYFIEHFREIFEQWNTLLNEMYSWKDATDAELAEWKSTVETGISSWETGLQQSMEDWKDETEADISAWEAATLASLDAWKTATTAVFEQIRTEAAASAQAAAGSATAAQTALAGAQAAQAAAEAAAAGIQSEAAQIQTNTADIADLKTQIDNIEDELYTSSEETYDWASDAEPGFPYNWRPGYLSPSTGSIGTNAQAIKENLRNNIAVSFGTAKYITIAPPSGYSVSRIIEYNNSAISANNYSRAIASNLAVNENYTFENVIGKYYAFVINGFDNSNNYYQDDTFTRTIVATLTYKTSRLDGHDSQISDLEQEVDAAQEAITDIENKYPKLVSKTNLNADFNTIKDAIAYANEHPNTVILVDSGEYDIIEELGGSEYTESLSGLSSYAGGLRLGNNTTIVGVGSEAKLIANYSAGTNQVMTDRFSIFNIVGSFKLENLEMEVTNVRYCVHEDMSALSAADRPGCYTGQYKNCRMKHNGTVSTTFKQACCIGGGTMNKSMHIIEGCSLESPTNKNPAGYHNNSTSNNGTAHVIVKNCYFANNGTMTFTIYNSNTQAINAEVDGCRLGQAIIDNSDGLFDIKAWNNVIA